MAAPDPPKTDPAPPVGTAAPTAPAPAAPAPPELVDSDLEDEEAGEAVLLLPTLTRSTGGYLVRPTKETHPVLYRYARKVDSLLAEAVQDMELSLSVSERPDFNLEQIDDRLLELGDDTDWVLLPELAVERGQLRVRLSVVAPQGKVVLLRSERVEPADLEVRLMVMIRDLVQAGRGTSTRTDTEKAELAPAVRAKGDGRAVLALNSAVLGGYIGYSLQRSSGSNDPRLTYPLIALGTGIGLGGSLIVADEWDVGLGDAWYLSAAMVWPTAAGISLASGYDVREEDQFAYGLVGAAAGVSLGTFALTFRGMGEGGAVLTHSGGLIGTLVGALTQVAYEGTSDITPTRGMGYGAGLGVLSAGILATQIELSASRVLMIDLGVGLGALTGAAVASPLVFADDPGATENRAWAGSVAGGAVVGALVAYFITPTETGGIWRSDRVAMVPYGGIIGASVDKQGESHPVPGFGLRGAF